jgi:hypothetical protein
MHLGNKGGFQEPGIYSTCFAIQLLAKSNITGKEDVAKEIELAFRYLQFEYDAAQTVAEKPQGREKSRQRTKKQKLGHTDFDLTLKNASVLDAANALGEIRTRHSIYSSVFENHATMFDGIANALKKGIKSSSADGTTSLTGWSWTVAENAAAPELIPTCYALTALTHSSHRTTCRYCDDPIAIAKSLDYMMRKTTIVSHRALALNCLKRFAATCDNFQIQELDESFEKEIHDAARELEENPRQETLHFDERIDEKQTLIHKPWIWIFPQLEVARAAMSLSVDVPDEVQEFSAKILRNARSNGGSVVFMRSVGADVLANLRSAEYLTEFAKRIDQLKFGWIRFSIVRLRLQLKRLLEKYPHILLTVLVCCLVDTFFGRIITESAAVNDSVDLFSRTFFKFIGVWPLWIFISFITVTFSKGGLRQRVWNAICALAVSVFLAIATNIV